jgi:hypothetical protein
MKHLTWIVILSIIFSVSVNADVKAKIEVVGPSIFFPSPPPVVVISNEISVVSGFEHEVFMVSGVYWTFNNGHWYKAKGPKKKWVKIKSKNAPPGLIKLPRGKYLKFKPGKGPKHKHHPHKGHKKGKGHKKE